MKMQRKVTKMKSNAKSKIIILIALGVIFALLPVITTNLRFIAGNSNKSSEYCDDCNLDNKNLKISAVSERIHIDNNWTAAKAAGICTGEGIYSDPYIIEDLIIDGGGSANCILIANSDVYFKIENCTVYNSTSFYVGNFFYSYAGIKLSHVSNSYIIDNDCLDNYFGIYLGFHSDNNTISGNIASNNDNGGIYLQQSNNNTLSGNTASNNTYYGIQIYYCNNNILSGNTANNNKWSGISLETCNNTTLSGNLMNFCGIILSGSLVEMASHNIDKTNLVNNKSIYYYKNEFGLDSSNFTNAGQIILVNCNNSKISGLNISDGSGIYLYYCVNNTISGNTASNNNWNGIDLYCSNNNTISGNHLTYNTQYGIKLANNANNTIAYRNCFIQNGINAIDDGYNNQWDNGAIGNYWDDYGHVDANNDGIGDTPYIISGTAGSQDNFPLMECPLPVPGDVIPLELIIIISVISGGAVIGVATLLLVRRKRKRIE